MGLEVKDISCGYGEKAILEHMSFNLEKGDFVCLLGPNGVGKTTVFRSMLGFLPLINGEILIDGIPKENMTRKEFSRHVGYVPQSHEPPFAFSVPDVIVMGRATRLNMLGTPGVKEYMIVDKVMEMLGISYLREKTYTQISGGERQMVMIARALVQNPLMLLMDEPTASLDYGNQVHVLECIKRLSNIGIGILMTTHSPDQAFLCSSRVILITRDKQVLEGPVEEIVTEENLRKAYGVEVKITETTDKNDNIVKTCVPMLDNI